MCKILIINTLSNFYVPYVPMCFKKIIYLLFTHYCVVLLWY